MNSRERVKKVLNNELPDKIPYGEYAIDSSVIEKVLGRGCYLRNKAKIQLALWENKREEVAQGLKEDIIDFYSKIDVIDIINLAADATCLLPPKDLEIRSPKKIDENTWIDSEDRIYKYSSLTRDIVIVKYPDTKKTLEDYEKEVKFKKPDESIFEVLDYVIKRFENKKFLIGPSGPEVAVINLKGDIERGLGGGNIGEALMEYYINPLIIKRVAELQVNSANKLDKYYIRNGIDGIHWGQDFSDNSGPMISPKMFEEFVVPFSKRRIKNIKKYFNLPIIKHACGNNWKLMDMFIEIGYDCYQSIQESAGMDFKKLIEDYGNKICLWGGINSELLMSEGKKNKKYIREYVKRALEIGSRSSGFILGTSHSIANGSDYGSYMTMLEAINDLREHY